MSKSAPKPPLTSAEMREAMLLSARLGGCTCSPTIELREALPNVFIAQVAHDRDCGHPSQRKGEDA